MVEWWGYSIVFYHCHTIGETQTLFPNTLSLVSPSILLYVPAADLRSVSAFSDFDRFSNQKGNPKLVGSQSDKLCYSNADSGVVDILSARVRALVVGHI